MFVLLYCVWQALGLVKVKHVHRYFHFGLVFSKNLLAVCTCNLWPAEYSKCCFSKYCTALPDLGVNSLGCPLLGKWETVLNNFHWWIIFLIIKWWFGNGLLTLHRLMLQSSNLPKPLLFRSAHTYWWSIYQPHLISNSCLLLTFLVSVELVRLYLVFF